MSDSIVLKKQCERCPAVEEIPVTPEDIKSGKYIPEKKGGPPKYEIKIGGEVVCSYTRLCANCDAAVKKDIANINKRPKKKTTQRST